MKWFHRTINKGLQINHELHTILPLFTFFIFMCKTTIVTICVVHNSRNKSIEFYILMKIRCSKNKGQILITVFYYGYGGL